MTRRPLDAQRSAPAGAPSRRRRGAAVLVLMAVAFVSAAVFVVPWVGVARAGPPQGTVSGAAAQAARDGIEARGFWLVATVTPAADGAPGAASVATVTPFGPSPAAARLVATVTPAGPSSLPIVTVTPAAAGPPTATPSPDVSPTSTSTPTGTPDASPTAPTPDASPTVPPGLAPRVYLPVMWREEG